MGVHAAGLAGAARLEGVKMGKNAQREPGACIFEVEREQVMSEEQRGVFNQRAGKQHAPNDLEGLREVTVNNHTTDFRDCSSHQWRPKYKKRNPHIDARKNIAVSSTVSLRQGGFNPVSDPVRGSY